MKKIAFVITKSNFGGAQRYVFDLATNLPKDQFDVVVITGGQGKLIEKLTASGIRSIFLPSLQRDISIKKELLSFKELYLILKNEKPDIVHLNSSKAGGMGALIARLLGIQKIIFTAHAWAFNENRNIFFKYLITLLHWLTVILSKETIAVSNSVKNQVSHLPFTQNKIKVIHLGIEEPQFLSKLNAEKELGIKYIPQQTKIITIAELHPVKGLLYSIDALSHIRDSDPDIFQNIHYYIYGEGDQKKSLEAYINKRKLSERIFLMGFKDDVSKYLKAFDIFLLPSLSEALGYVLLEAGFANIPIIASNVGGIPEIIRDGVRGTLVERKNLKSIETALDKVILGHSDIKEMSDELYRYLKKGFRLQEMVQETINLYRK